MSGRSAFVRKKANDAIQKQNDSRSRPQSISTSSSNDGLIPDFPLPPINTSDYPRTPSEPWAGNRGPWNGPGSPMMTSDTRRDAFMSNQVTSSTEDWVHGRQRKPTALSIKTEEFGGIEKSGLRTMLDKRSEDVRKGLAKTFAFRKKDKEEKEEEQTSHRPPSFTNTIPITISTQDQGSFSPMPIQTPQYASSQYASSQSATSQYAPSQYPLPSPPSPQTLWPIPPIGPPPTSKLPPIPGSPPTAAALQMKRWLGGGRPAGRWNKLRKDPELWDPNGDVLIYLARRGKKLPSFRLSSHIVEATGSKHLIKLLREGSTEEDFDPPLSPTGTNAPLTPPASEGTSIGDYEGQISYEMFFPPPQNGSRIDQLRHQITTRNVFALLCHASIVGLSLHQALSDLHVRLDSYMPPYNDNVSQIVRYLSSRSLNDVRSDPETAVSLLAWAEGPDVRWADGWRECFLHCVGMSERVEKCKDSKCVTPITKAMLDRASMEMQVRVQSAEERLADFDFDDMWAHSQEVSAAKSAAERLQRMFQGHYERIHGEWPPAPPESDAWLTRTLAMELQKDFGALYDYLVNRDIVWDVSEARSGRKWMMASESGTESFEPDTVEVPMTDMLIEFDNKQRFPHIPHPYPLVPQSISPVEMAVARDPGGLFRRGKKMEENPNASKMERRVQLAYMESTNIYTLGSDFAANELVAAFDQFEKSDRVGDVNPAAARQGRWVLIYGILQTLASVCVDDEKKERGYRLGSAGEQKAWGKERMRGRIAGLWGRNGAESRMMKDHPERRGT
ncbi:hypothetical protein FDECE_15915 [Fusarium decemcellulare]|nr:hypothetical protein FDECE_15915 [Fusarium decemcellulare]